MMVGNNLKDAQLQQIVDKTIIYSDKDGDGKISYEEFCAVSELIIQSNSGSRHLAGGPIEYVSQYLMFISSLKGGAKVYIAKQDGGHGWISPWICH